MKDAIFWGLMPHCSEEAFLLWLLFDSEDRGEVFLRNVRIPPTYTCCNPDDSSLYSHRFGNLKRKKLTQCF
jgi:hypothetical protein